MGKDNKTRKLVVTVSSSVYGIEELLDRVYTLLTAFGYEVWMSHKGTMPVFSDRSNFENCLAAVSECAFGCYIPVRLSVDREALPA